MTNIMISTVTPVARDHSRPFPAILVTAQITMIGALTIIWSPIVINICTWVMSLVERVIRLSVEKRLISSIENESTREKSWLRIRWENEAAMRAAKNPTMIAETTLPSAQSSILPPASQISPIALPGVCVSRVISDI